MTQAIQDQFSKIVGEFAILTQMIASLEAVPVRVTRGKCIHLSGPSGTIFGSLTEAAKWAIENVEDFRNLAVAKRKFYNIQENSILAIVKKSIQGLTEDPTSDWKIIK